jgi:hypothetical protein
VKGTPADMDGGVATHSEQPVTCLREVPIDQVCSATSLELSERERKIGAGNEIFSYIRFFYSRYSLRTISTGKKFLESKILKVIVRRKH